MSEPCRIYDDPASVVSRLDELGLRPEWLSLAVQRGVGEVLACTANDPQQLPGILGWGRITRFLRELLIERRGYERANLRGQPSTVHPDGKFAIVVAGGDENTGRRTDPDPATRSTKGPATEDAIEKNTLSLWWDMPEAEWGRFDKARRIVPPKQTWMLLYIIDEAAEEVRLELSLPRFMDEDGYVTDWSDRIIIKSFPLPTKSPVVIPDDDDGDEEISITRKTG